MADQDYDDPLAQSMVAHWFHSHPLKGDQANRLASLRDGAHLFARHLLHHVPCCYEREEALKAIDSAYSWAQRAIERAE